MIVSIHQPNFFPWIGYFHKINSSDKFVFLDNVDIVLGSKGAITHRTKILTPQGELWLTVPLVISESKKINEILINNNQPWKEKQLNVIYNTYKKAPCFNKTFEFIKFLYSSDIENLAEFNKYIIVEMCGLLEIDTEMYISSSLPVSTTDKNDRIIEICKYLNGSVYLSGNGAKKYNDESKYINNNIKLVYTTFAPPPYKHFNHPENIKGLSIIDVLMNIELSDVKSILQQ
jgi:hypothetical protein